ncbi:MAG: hypothetical protein Q9221_003605 [Calogaya cf. arnoldii]
MSTQPKLKRKSAMLNLFVSQKEINKLKADLQLRQNRRKPPTATTTPAPAEPTPPTTPAPVPESTAPTPQPWTTVEDFALLHLCTISKPYAEIAKTLSRTETECEARWKEIGLPATITAEQEVEPAKEAEDKTEPAKADTNVNANEGKGGGKQKGGKQKAENKQQKGNTKAEGGKKGKGKPDQAKVPDQTSFTIPPDASTEASPTDGTFTDPLGPQNHTSAIIANARDQKVRGILKRGTNSYTTEEVTIPVGATSVNGRPIIYIEENDPLGVEELSLLYQHHMALEEQRWIHMSSKFFDQTGKRIEPEWLRRKLGGVRL